LIARPAGTNRNAFDPPGAKQWRPLCSRNPATSRDSTFLLALRGVWNLLLPTLTEAAFDEWRSDGEYGATAARPLHSPVTAVQLLDLAG
jgi:hypothetical protein